MFAPSLHGDPRRYARALKLPPGSEDWYTFFDLAAAGTGTVPQQVIENSIAREALLRMFRALRPGARRVQPWVSAVDIGAWADYKEARNQFPRLIRRLVHATSTFVERIEFAAGEGGERRGWDGLVSASDGTEFVPAGISCWELGVGGDPARKASDDFRARTNDPLGVNTSEATFIFVTARRWEGKSKWEAEQNKLRKWRAVRVYDADSLEEWLELAPKWTRGSLTLLGNEPGECSTSGNTGAIFRQSRNRS